MASPANAALCALIASAFWTLLGYRVGRHLLPRVLAFSPHPSWGGALHSAALLPIVVWTGFSLLIIGLIGVLCIGLRLFSLAWPVPTDQTDLMNPRDYGLSAARATRTAVSARRSKKAST